MITSQERVHGASRVRVSVGYFFREDLSSRDRHPTGALFPSLKKLGERKVEMLGRVAEAYYSSL